MATRHFNKVALHIVLEITVLLVVREMLLLNNLELLEMRSLKNK